MLNLRNTITFFLKSFSNYHTRSDKKDIFLFATPRGGSTWVMEILASQTALKYYDEPFNVRRMNVQKTKLFQSWQDIMPESNNTETIITYIQSLQNNNYKFMNPPPFRKHHRFYTNRSIFKIHEIEHLVNEIQTQCNGSIVYLLRHPIPTTLSRNVYPRLELFINSKYYQDNYISSDQLKEIKKIYSKGNDLQKGIVSWCYENLIPLKYAKNDDWLFVSYEEILLNSEKSCKSMADYLKFDDINKMMEAINIPSTNIKMSNTDTLKIMQSRDNVERKKALVTKWKNKISTDDERACFDILGLFDLDVYSFNRYIPTDKYLLHSDTILQNNEL